MKTTQFLVMILSISMSGVATAHPTPAVQIQITSNIPVACIVQLVIPDNATPAQAQQAPEPRGLEINDRGQVYITKMHKDFLENSYRQAMLASKNYAPFMQARQSIPMQDDEK